MDSRRQLAALLPKLLPELWMVGVALALALWPERVGLQMVEGLYLVALAEVVFCLAQGTITDLATRLRKRPPWWLLVLIVGGLALFYPDGVRMARAAFAQGWAVFVPFAWSLFERVRELWTLPEASRLEKLRRRALVSGRMALVLVFAWSAVAVACISYVLDSSEGGFVMLEGTAGWWLAGAFAAAAFDIVRVHRPAFENRPRALLRRFDPLGVEDLSPL
jgi:hypothetical protein